MSLLNKKQHEKDYISNQCIDCPHCSQDRPDHSCPNCHSEIEHDICWKYGGLCKNCFVYIHEELPKIRLQKQALGIKCQCDDSQCAKCLLVNCQDNNCITHPNVAKDQFKIKYKNR